MMDISPLPHKQPYFAHIDIQSPTPGHTPTEDIVLPSSPPRPAFLEAPKPSYGQEYVKLHYAFRFGDMLIYFSQET